MENEPVVSSGNQVSTDVRSAEDIWGSTSISAQNIVLPKLRPLSSQSKLCKGKDADFREGDIVETLTNTKVADFEKPVHVIPFHREYLWVEYEKVGNLKKYRGSYTATPENEKQDWTFKRDGVDWERDYTIRVYVLLVDQIKDGAAIPHFIDFSRTGLFNGRKLDTLMYVTNVNAGLFPPGFTIQVKSEEKNNDDNSWAVPTFSKDRKSTADEIKVCAEWVKTIASGKAKADEKVMDEEVVTAYDGEKEGEEF